MNTKCLKWLWRLIFFYHLQNDWKVNPNQSGIAIYIYIYIYIFHHQVALLAQISLTLSHHLSISSSASGMSSRLHPESVQSCWQVLVEWPTIAHQCAGVHWRISLMSSSLLLQQCLTCIICLIRMVLEIGGRWSYSCCFVGCCFQDLFNRDNSILVQFSSSFFFICFVSIHAMNPYNWNRSDFYMFNNLMTLIQTIYIYISGDSSLFLLLMPPTAFCQLQFPTRFPWTQSKSS